MVLIVEEDKQQSQIPECVILQTYVIRSAIWYHLYNFKNVKTPIEGCYF